MSKIIIEREKCIGCGSCVALCPKYFKMGDDGKSSLVAGLPAQAGKRDSKTGSDELEVENLECAQSAADACPVQCIHAT